MKLLLKVFTFLGIIWRKLKGFNEKYVFPALEILTIIRTALTSKEFDWIVELTKTDWDNKMRDKIVKKLSASIFYLKIEYECFDKKNSHEETITCFIEYLKGHPQDVQDAILNKLAAVMVRKSMPPQQQIKQFEADLIVQMAYSTNKEYKNRLPQPKQEEEETES